ncbi:unnamed protein product [Bursaphelenchus xylophilus]|uniref:(pine wood nematode) hypothetical protein n=1 Tax=Bursaphelenchus xylophilus TaxID=6326 RepID=A0A1I7SW36_BURXY|nr:unnamed protein product [Bursaphelenchus xylophilus]CAG9098749.1 unnamed protein product [Bursaphelenchus xylophilus]
MIQLKKMVRALKNRREIVLELNNTNTAVELMENQLKKKVGIKRRSSSLRYFFGDSKRKEMNLKQDIYRRRKPLEKTVYENEDAHQVSSSTSAACSRFSVSNGGEIFGDDLRPAIYSITKDDYHESGKMTVTLDNHETSSKINEQDSVHSFAIDPKTLEDNKPSAIVLESWERAEKMVSEFFGSTTEFLETSVQSSLEAYNEYIRLKHTILIIQKMAQSKDEFLAEGSSEMLKLCLNGLISSLESAMKNLEKDYPRLHTYARQKGMKFHKKGMQKIGEDAVEF